MKSANSLLEEHAALANPMVSESLWTAPTLTEVPGETPIENEPVVEVSLTTVLDRAWRYRLMVSSDFAREHSEAVAEAASLGYISTEFEPFEYGRQWLITEEGLTFLWSSF